MAPHGTWLTCSMREYSLAHSSIGTRSLLAELSLFVSRWFQILFHWVFHPSFHLSLAVLVHYRSCLVFSLGVWSPQIQPGVCRLLVYLGTLFKSIWISRTRLSRSLVFHSKKFCYPYNFLLMRSCNPRVNTGLDCSLFARRLLRESLTISTPPGT